MCVLVCFKIRYHDILQWENGAVAYISRYTLVISNTALVSQFCGMIGLDRLSMEHCDYAITNTFLCKEGGTPAEIHKSDQNALGRRGFQLSKAANSSILSAFNICSSGHWTHKLLACDPRSNCYQDYQSRSGKLRNVRSPCQTILQTQFTCRNEVGQVPYSLVCDHSQDCLDSSDEDFCVHPTCSASWQFECVNMQVCNAR